MSWRRFTRRQGCRRCVLCAGSCKNFRKLSKIHCQGTDQYIPAVALVGMSWITGCEPFEHCRAQDPALVGLGLLPRACCYSPTVGMGQNLRKWATGFGLVVECESSSTVTKFNPFPFAIFNPLVYTYIYATLYTISI
jgi:hypothetical protein